MKKTWGFIQVVMIVFVLSLVTCGVSLAEELKNYSFPDGGFSVSFPVNWVVEKLENGCDAKAEELDVNVKITDEGKMGATLEEFVTVYRAELKKQFSENYKEEKLENLTIGGYKAKLVGFSTIVNEVTVKGYIYIVDVEGDCAVIMMLTSDTNNAKAVPYFKQILGSIKFI